MRSRQRPAASHQPSAIGILGGGLAGLALGALLAHRGHRVTVYERDRAGGKLRRLVVGGLAFDTGPSLFTLPEVWRAFLAHLGEPADPLELRPLPGGLGLHHTPFGTVPLPVPPGHPLHAAWESYCAPARLLAPHLTPLLTTPPRLSDPAFRQGGTALFRATGGHLTALGWVRSRRLPPALAHAVATHALNAGLAPGDAPALYALLPALVAGDVSRPAAGMGALLDTLLALGRARGVRVEEGAEVVRVDPARAALTRTFSEMPVPPSVLARIEQTFGEPLTPEEVVSRILSDVRARGDEALRDWTERLDGHRPEALEVSGAELEAAQIEPELHEAVRLAIRRVRAFYAEQPAHVAPRAARLLNEPAEHEAVVRFSRSVGLPRPLPDLLGMSIRVPDAYGDARHQDLLLVTSADLPIVHHVFLPAGTPPVFEQEVAPGTPVDDLVASLPAPRGDATVVLVNGRPLSIRWIAENVPAIVEAWLPGEKGGRAVAEVLFGEVNPSGRLPVTVPRHSGQLPVTYDRPPSKDYWVERGWGRRYADMSAKPLWEFGHGLSYTSFEYSNLRIETPRVRRDGEVRLSVDVANTGARAGAEVVQLYIRDVLASVTTPVKQLRGFERVELKPGEKKTVRFTLRPQDLSLLDRSLKPVVEPGEFRVMIGRSSEDIRLRGSFVVTE